MPYHHLGAASRGEAAVADGKLSAASDVCSGGNEPSAAGEASSRPDAAPDGSAACAHVASASSFVAHDVVCKSDPCAGKSPAETALTLGAPVGGRQGRRQEKRVSLKLKGKYFDDIINGLKTMDGASEQQTNGAPRARGHRGYVLHGQRQDRVCRGAQRGKIPFPGSHAQRPRRGVPPGCYRFGSRRGRLQLVLVLPHAYQAAGVLGHRVTSMCTSAAARCRST